MIVETDKLLTIHNFAMLEIHGPKKKKCTATYIYRMAKEGRLKLVIIDGIKFIDTSVTPAILPPKKETPII